MLLYSIPEAHVSSHQRERNLFGLASVNQDFVEPSEHLDRSAAKGRVDRLRKVELGYSSAIHRASILDADSDFVNDVIERRIAIGLDLDFGRACSQIWGARRSILMSDIEKFVYERPKPNSYWTERL